MVESLFEILQSGIKNVNDRSSHQSCSIKNAVLKNFAIFTGKQLCWSLSLIKLQIRRPARLIKETPTQESQEVHSCEYCGIFKNTYFEYLRTAASVLGPVFLLVEPISESLGTKRSKQQIFFRTAKLSSH